MLGWEISNQSFVFKSKSGLHHEKERKVVGWKIAEHLAETSMLDMIESPWFPCLWSFCNDPALSLILQGSFVLHEMVTLMLASTILLPKCCSVCSFMKCVAHEAVAQQLIWSTHHSHLLNIHVGYNCILVSVSHSFVSSWLVSQVYEEKLHFILMSFAAFSFSRKQPTKLGFYHLVCTSILFQWRL